MNGHENLKILYVEDSEENKQYVLKALKREYENIVVASDGQEGLDTFLKTKDFHLIITDITMPNMDGLTMIEEIKKISPDIYTVLITAHNDSDYLLRSIDLKVDKYVLKPINLKELIQTVKSIDDIVQNKSIIKTQKKVLQEYKNVIDEFLIVVKADITGTINFANNKFLETCGYSKEEIIGNKFSKVHHVLMDSSKFKEMWNDVINGKTHKITIRDKKSDGSSYWLESFIYPILDENEEVKEIISISKDITQEIKTEKEKEEKRAKEKRKELTKAMDVNINNLLSLIPFPSFELSDGKIRKYNDGFEEIVSSNFEAQIYSQLLEKEIEVEKIFDEEFEFKLFSSIDDIFVLKENEQKYKMRYKKYNDSLIVSMIDVD